MAIIPVVRTNRPLNGYMACNTRDQVTNSIELIASHAGERNGHYFVRFKKVMGVRGVKNLLMPPFWDVDVATAVLQWNKDNGGDPVEAYAYGHRFTSRNQDDVMMMRLAFS